MFTGLVSDQGRVLDVADAGGVRRLRIASAYAPDSLVLGASVLHSGVCLSLTDFGASESGSWWTVEAVQETLQRTTIGEWTSGRRVNLERSLRVGDELGGHFVAGHVDGLGAVLSVTEEGGSWRVRFAAPHRLSGCLAEKGSIAVDGVSLTIAGVSGAHEAATWFEVAIIPHTLAVTTLGGLSTGDSVHLEVDLLARYVARMLEAQTR
jgi:riboflavin synthase